MRTKDLPLVFPPFPSPIKDSRCVGQHRLRQPRTDERVPTKELQVRLVIGCEAIYFAALNMYV